LVGGERPNRPARSRISSLELAENIRAEFRIGVRTDLHEVLKGDKPDTKAMALREKITAFAAGKSQRQLLIGIGKPGATRGGWRERIGQKHTEEEIRAAWLEDAPQPGDLRILQHARHRQRGGRTLEDARR